MTTFTPTSRCEAIQLILLLGKRKDEKLAVALFMSKKPDGVTHSVSERKVHQHQNGGDHIVMRTTVSKQHRTKGDDSGRYGNDFPAL